MWNLVIMELILTSLYAALMNKCLESNDNNVLSSPLFFNHILSFLIIEYAIYKAATIAETMIKK